MGLNSFLFRKYAWLLPFLLLIFCAQGNKVVARERTFSAAGVPAVTDTAHYDRTTKNVTFFEKPMSGFVIGNLYNIRLDDGRYGNLLLAAVEMDQMGVRYYFYMGSKIYAAPPNLSDVLQAGLIGNTIAIVNDGGVRYIPAFKVVPFTDTALRKYCKAFVAIGSIKYMADSSQNGGSSGDVQSLAELSAELASSIKLLSMRQQQDESLMGVRSTVVAFDYIATTRDSAKAAKPKVVWIFNEKEISAAARQQLGDSFYFDEVNEFAPIGNDAGNDVLYGYHNWRQANPNENIMTYARVLQQESGLPFPDLNVTEMSKVDYQEIGYVQAEQQIIGLCYAQIILEGKLEPGLKKIGLRSLQRQWSKEFLTLIPEELHAEWLHALDLEQKGLEKF